MSAAPGSTVTVVVLAAGEGTRMRSAKPKVLHELCGDTMLGHVVRAASALDAGALVVVVGHGREQVTAALPEHATAVVQEPQGGTGHALRQALDAHPAAGIVVVAPGDAPMLRGETLQALVARHAESGAAATVLTARLADPTGYGRVVRNAAGDVSAIVEERDADESTRAIDEVAVSVYAFDGVALTEALTQLSTDNAQGEEYLTDVIGLLHGAGRTVAAFSVADAAETQGINDRIQLATVRRAFRDRILREAMLAGVTVIDPETTWMGVHVTYEPDVEIRPNTHLHGATHLGAGAVVGPNTVLNDTVVGARASVNASICTEVTIGEASTIGPYAHLRPGTTTGVGAKIGAFVETKAASLGNGTKVPHLAYVGDARVGDRSNIGCGTVVVNYDGVNKHRTEIGVDVRIGSNNSLIAPVTIGDGAYTGADAVIRRDVPAGALAYSTNEQVTRTGWVSENRPAGDTFPDIEIDPDVEIDPDIDSDSSPSGTIAPSTTTGDAQTDEGTA